MCAKFDDYSFSRSRDIIGAAKFKVGHLTLTTSLLRVIWHQCAGTSIAYLCTKFDHSIFSRSKYMVGAHQNLNGLRDVTTPLSGIICNPLASTCYDQPIYQI